jgi:hypothetical protein
MSQEQKSSEQQFPDDCYCSEGCVRMGKHDKCELEGRCCSCDCVFFYEIDPADPVYWKICDECVTKGVIEP